LLAPLHSFLFTAPLFLPLCLLYANHLKSVQETVKENRLPQLSFFVIFGVVQKPCFCPQKALFATKKALFV
jgi:hypothetical protein